MSKATQVYYTAVLGALGGLLGWWIMGSLPTGAWNVWLAYPLVGMGLGACIGGCIAATDGALIKRSLGRALRDGLAGGLVGGLAGGALDELMTQAFLAQSDRAQVVVGGVGLIVLGACIGGLIPLARQVFSRGELRVLNGEQAGLVREVTDTASIGRYDGCDLYLPDAAVAWRHALIRHTAQGFACEVLPEAEVGVMVGTRRVAPGETAALRGGDRIWLGDTALEFVGR